MDVRALLEEAAARHNVPVDLVMKVARQESAFNQRAVSSKGAIGVMQLMPGTARDLGVDPHDMGQNIDGGVRYLGQQLKTFGEPRLALAAYNAGPGAVRKYGGVPPYAETKAYVDATSGDRQMPEFDGASIFGGGGGSDAAPQSAGFDGSAIFATPAAKPKPGPLPKPKPMPAPVAPVAPTVARRDQMLGFGKGAFTPVDHAAGWLESAIRGTGAEAPLTRVGAGLRGMLPKGVTSFIDNPQGFYDAQAQKGVLPGKVGEFAGNVAGTAWVPGGPLVQGLVGGALLSDKKDLGGVAGDAAIGGVTGRLAAGASDALQIGARKVLSRVPKVMNLPALQKAVTDAYTKVDASGFAFPKTDVSALADDFAKSVAGSALSKSAKDDAREIIDYTRGLASGDLPLSQLEKLRGDIYEAMVKKGGDTGRLGGQFRAKIDQLIDAVPNGDVRAARELNARLKKTQYVDRASRSADIAAEKTYGGDYGRKVKDRLNPLIDPMMPNKNLRGGTPDELAAIERIVRGTKTQNVASTVGGMLDPRRLGGKIVTGALAAAGGAGAPFSAGTSLLIPAAQMAAGFGLTGTASKIARKNVDDLLKLFAVGGSKQVLGGATKASHATEKAIAALRPALVAASVPALAAAKPKPKKK